MLYLSNCSIPLYSGAAIDPESNLRWEYILDGITGQNTRFSVATLRNGMTGSWAHLISLMRVGSEGEPEHPVHLSLPMLTPVH